MSDTVTKQPVVGWVECERCLGTGEAMPGESADGHAGYCQDCGGMGRLRSMRKGARKVEETRSSASAGSASRSPNKYDLAFAKWFARWGWRVCSFWYSAPVVWTHDDATCPFKVTKGMVKRLEEAGIMERYWPAGSGVGDEYWRLAT